MLFQYVSYFFSMYLHWLLFRRFVWKETEVRTNGCWQWFIMVCAEKEVIVSVIKGQGEAGIKFTAQLGGCFGGDIIHEVKYERGKKKEDVFSSFSCANSLLFPSHISSQFWNIFISFLSQYVKLTSRELKLSFTLHYVPHASKIAQHQGCYQHIH